jgi:diguanylate cyclase (GGDEF)-like protein/PAS domain S-box-containing protein
MLLEDTPSDALLVQEMLSKGLEQECDVTHVTKVEDALEVLGTDTDFDVLLTDLCVVDSQGLDTFRSVRSAAETIPIIVQSGLEEQEIGVEAVRLGAQDYLVKGRFDTQTLVRSIRYALERKRGEKALRDSEERYAISVRGANDGLWDWDLRMGRIYESARWKAILGYSPHELDETADTWFSLVHPEDVDRLARAVQAHIDGRSDHLECEHRVTHKDGSELWVLTRGVAMRDDEGTAYRMAGSLTDITSRKKAEARLLHDAFHDKLTGLPNRALCMDRLAHTITRTRRSLSRRFAVLFLDLDRFKLINDSLGHSFGDKLLRSFTTRVRALLRPSDTFARLGGDEFCILLEDVQTLQDAEVVAARILKSVEDPFIIQGQHIFSSVSIGIVESHPRYQQPEEMLRDADLAMYRAKNMGKARHAVFDTKLHAQAVARLDLETAMRYTLNKEEFELYYQPIVCLSSGDLVGFESLIRWNCPDRGMVPPSRFIPVAEESGLIVPIGNWALKEAVGELSSWGPLPAARNPVTVAVNLSPRQFLQPGLVECVRDILDTNGLDPSRLVLEITENAFIDYSSAARNTFAGLKKLGVHIHLDDFGTGFSSLSLLRQFPIDKLKIDRSFVLNMLHNKEDKEIVKAIVALGKSLDKGVIAEGIECAEQMDQLRSLGCEFGQGYYFARPDRASKRDIYSSGAIIARTARTNRLSLRDQLEVVS